MSRIGNLHISYHWKKKRLTIYIYEKNKERVSNEIRERNREKKFQTQDTPSIIIREQKNLQSNSQHEGASIDSTLSRISNSEASAKAHKSEQTSIDQKVTRNQMVEQGLIQELTEFIIVESIEIKKSFYLNDKKTVTVQSLVHLYQKASLAEKNTIQAKQEEILCWYYYGKDFEKMVSEILSNPLGIEAGCKNNKRTNDLARGQIYDEMISHLSGITRENLRKKTQRIIKQVRSYSATTISCLTDTNTQNINSSFSKNRTRSIRKQGLVQVKEDPNISRQGIYKVVLETNEDEARAMSQSVLTGLSRLPNILFIHGVTNKYVLIDFEHANVDGLVVSERLKDWNDNTLTNKNKYTKQSDLYQFGKMLRNLNVVNSEAGKKFLDGLGNKRIHIDNVLEEREKMFLVIPTNAFFRFPVNNLRYGLSIFKKESINDVKTKIQWHFPEEFKNIPFNIRVFDLEAKT
ncbi:hypothetical protein Glove_123g109 [Diversispora epigaea]|uniref:Uncharacterized protein n=1 Tax=Diversispora epigaea TaxID=1348612 RepID=A0A397J7W8_9GLOM|nr:hypothetical protein Glove_123g109 [Diversispora epigaea]